MKLLPILLAMSLFITGCPLLQPYPETGCRNFKMTTWGQNASPWNEVDWNQIVIIDEPMLDIWGWKGDLNNPADVCGPIGLQMVQAQITAGKLTGKKVWLNWSYEEFSAVYQFCGNNVGLDADIVSFDSYGGKWDWYLKTEHLLNLLHDNLAPGQKMGLVPESHYAPDWGVRWSVDDYLWIETTYFNWAMDHDGDGSIYAYAPFQWGPCRNPNNSDWCIADEPRMITNLSMLARQHPICTP